MTLLNELIIKKMGYKAEYNSYWRIYNNMNSSDEAIESAKIVMEHYYDKIKRIEEYIKLLESENE